MNSSPESDIPRSRSLLKRLKDRWSGLGHKRRQPQQLIPPSTGPVDVLPVERSQTFSPSSHTIIVPSPQLSAGTSSASLTQSLPPNARDLWAEARVHKDLGPKNRAVLDTIICKTTSAKDEINALLTMTRNASTECESKSWKFEFCGRTVLLRDQADKIITWLDKFKEVGDTIVQYDPGHAALPWAGFRLLLQIAVVEREQLGALLLGMERATNIVSRCTIYEVLYLKSKLADQVSCDYRQLFEQLEKHLLDVYISVLRFLGKSKRTFDRSGLRRAAHGILNPEKLNNLLINMQSLDTELMKLVSTCETVDRRREQDQTCSKLRSIEKQMKIGFSTILDQVKPMKGEVSTILKVVGAERRAKILQFISQVPYESDHELAYRGHTKGTGAWLLRHRIFQEWRASSTSMILWLHGIPGAGKTKLIANAVETLQRDLETQGSQHGFAYFYCNRNIRDRRETESILQCFVRQLSTPPDAKSIPETVENRYALKEIKGFASNSFSFEECATLMRELVSNSSQVILVLDALDECDKSTRHVLIKELDNLVKIPSCTLKVLISSRPDQDIKFRFAGGPNVNIRATDNENDIWDFIEDRIDGSPPHWKSMIESSHGLQDEIRTALVDKAAGMFQWVNLQLMQLFKLQLAHDIKTRLGKLPKDLKEAYDEIMNEIKESEGSESIIAERAFMWVMCSKKPMSADALAVVVCQDTNIDGITDPCQIDFVLAACQNLLKLDEERLCRFSHLSVQEYLEEHQYSQTTAHCFVGSVCLSVLLNHCHFDDNSRLLHKYATRFWFEHVSFCDKNFELLNDLPIGTRLSYLLQTFMGSPTESSAPYRDWVSKFDRLNFRLTPSSCAIFVLVGFGFTKILSQWWDSGFDVELRNDDGYTLLYIASLASSFSSAKALIHYGANVNVQGGIYGNARRAAACNSSEETCRLLLEHGADVNAQGGEYGNALQAAACSSKSGETCQLLLDHGANANAQGGIYGNALQAAACNGSEDTCRLLLEHGADANAQGGHYENALQAAAWNGFEKTCRLLLDHGADVNAQGGHYGNALQAAACSSKSGETCQLLLDHGADVNAQGGHYGNALQVAARNGSEETCRLLLDHGADVNAQGGDYGNALQAASRNVSEETCRLLLDHGADANAQGGIYGNALQAAAWNGSEKTCRLLLDHGADVNAQGGHYGNALQVAAYYGSEEMCRLLLDHGADVNAQGGYYGNALRAANQRNKSGVVKLLLEAGAKEETD